jgi:hypothetical protein
VLEDVAVHHPGARIRGDQPDVDLLVRMNEDGVAEDVRSGGIA